MLEIFAVLFAVRLPCMATPLAPFNVNAPEEVVKLEAPPASHLIPSVPAFISTVIAFNSTSVVTLVALPNLIVLADEPVPTLIL